LWRLNDSGKKAWRLARTDGDTNSHLPSMTHYLEQNLIHGGAFDRPTVIKISTRQFSRVTRPQRKKICHVVGRMVGPNTIVKPKGVGRGHWPDCPPPLLIRQRPLQALHRSRLSTTAMFKTSKRNYRSIVMNYACDIISICCVRRLLGGAASVGRRLSLSGVQIDCVTSQSPEVRRAL
jgi:hypothetical protein